MVSKVTLFILVIMSIGTWYIMITKCLQQGKIRKQAKEAEHQFWESSSLDNAAQNLDEASVYRFIAEKGIKSTKTMAALYLNVSTLILGLRFLFHAQSTRFKAI